MVDVIQKRNKLYYSKSWSLFLSSYGIVSEVSRRKRQNVATVTALKVLENKFEGTKGPRENPAVIKHSYFYNAKPLHA